MQEQLLKFIFRFIADSQKGFETDPISKGIPARLVFGTWDSSPPQSLPFPAIFPRHALLSYFMAFHLKSCFRQQAVLFFHLIVKVYNAAF